MVLQMKYKKAFRSLKLIEGKLLGFSQVLEHDSKTQSHSSS